MTTKIDSKPGYHSVEKYREEKLKRHADMIKAIAEAHVDAGTYWRGVLLVDEFGNITRVDQKKAKVTVERIIPKKAKPKVVKAVKAKDLTMAQANTLHRLREGIGYRLRTDGKRAVNATFVSAPSIPVLYRLGLVDFTNGKPDEAGKFAPVMLTQGGWDILEEFDKAVGGK